MASMCRAANVRRSLIENGGSPIFNVHVTKENDFRIFFFSHPSFSQLCRDLDKCCRYVVAKAIVPTGVRLFRQPGPWALNLLPI